MNNIVILEDVNTQLKKIETHSIDLIIADPPYYLLNNIWDKKQFLNIDMFYNYMQICLSECYRVLKKDGNIFWFSHWKIVNKIIAIAKKNKFLLKNWIIWERNKGRSSKVNYKSIREDILLLCKIKKSVFYEQKKIRPVIAPYKDENGKPKGWIIDENGNRIRWTGVGNIWHYTPPVWSSKENLFHPTQKPIMMMKRMIESTTIVNDIILDLFAGSGSASFMAKELKRNSIAIENNEIYYRKIKNRLSTRKIRKDD